MRFLLEKVSPDMWKFPVLSGRKEYLGLGVAGRALAAAGLAGAVGAGARGVGAGHFGRCLGGLGRKVMCFGGRSLMLVICYKFLSQRRERRFLYRCSRWLRGLRFNLQLQLQLLVSAKTRLAAWETAYRSESLHLNTHTQALAWPTARV